MFVGYFGLEAGTKAGGGGGDEHQVLTAEVSLLLDGIGLSLVNNITARDIIYLRLAR